MKPALVEQAEENSGLEWPAIPHESMEFVGGSTRPGGFIYRPSEGGSSRDADKIEAMIRTWAVVGAVAASGLGRSLRFRACGGGAQYLKGEMDRVVVTFTAVYMKAPEGYVAFVEELPGAPTQGATLDEARESLREAVDLVLEANRTLAEQSLDKICRDLDVPEP